MALTEAQEEGEVLMEARGEALMEGEGRAEPELLALGDSVRETRGLREALGERVPVREGSEDLLPPPPALREGVRLAVELRVAPLAGGEGEPEALPLAPTAREGLALLEGLPPAVAVP